MLLLVSDWAWSPPFAAATLQSDLSVGIPSIALFSDSVSHGPALLSYNFFSLFFFGRHLTEQDFLILPMSPFADTSLIYRFDMRTVCVS